MEGYAAKYEKDEKDSPQAIKVPKEKGEQEKRKMDSDRDAKNIK